MTEEPVTGARTGGNTETSTRMNTKPNAGLKKKTKKKDSLSTRVLTSRDEAMLIDIYLNRYLTAYQLAVMYFMCEKRGTDEPYPSPQAADRRMQRLALDGWVMPHRNLQPAPGNTYKLWTLTEKTFERQRAILRDNPDTKMPPRPPLAYLDHRVGVADVYRGCSYALRMLIGEPTLQSPLPPGAWSWYHEGKLDRIITVARTSQKLKPDAELHISGHIFFIEYQTEESRIGAEAMGDKVSNYSSYFTHILPQQTDSQGQLVVVSDAGWVIRATERKVQETGLNAVAGGVAEMTEHLISQLGE